MLKGRDNISDLVFSPGHAPQMEISGQLVEIKFKGMEKLTPTDTTQIARDLMVKSELAAQRLEKEGATDLSYSLPPMARVSLQYFPAARHLRHRDARDSDRRPHV